MKLSSFKTVTYLITAPALFLSGCGHMEPSVKQPVAAARAVRPLLGASLNPTLDCSGTGLYQELMDPPALNAQNLQINTQLSAKPANKCVNGKNVILQSYIDTNAGLDSRAVGPTYSLDVDPSLPNPQLKIQFTNELGDKTRQYDCHSSQDVGLCSNLACPWFPCVAEGLNGPVCGPVRLCIYRDIARHPAGELSIRYSQLSSSRHALAAFALARINGTAS